MTIRTFVRSRTALLSTAIALSAACSDGGVAQVQTPPPSSIPDIATFPPMANDAPPGASASAIAAAAALGRGVNFGNMFEAPKEGDWGLTVTDDFIDKAAAAGFASVRLPVRWSNHAGATAPYTIDAAFLARVTSVIDKLLAKNLVVIVNMHHYRQLDGDTPDAGELAIAAGAVDVRFLMLWDQIATHLQSRGPRLLFELYNEPHGRLNGEPWNVLAARALRVVRRTNPDRIVVIGPSGWNSANELQRFKMPNDANIVATVHNYDPFRFTHQGAEWVSPVLPVGVTCCSSTQTAEMAAPLDVAKAWSVAKRYPVFVGEFGAYGKADEASRIDFNRKMRQAMESRGMTWSYWEFASGFGVYDPSARVFRQALLSSLLGQ